MKGAVIYVAGNYGREKTKVHHELTVPAVTFVVGHKGLAASPVQTGAVQAEVNHFLAEGSPVAGDADTAKATPLSPALCPIKAGLACAEVTLVLAV